MLPRYQHLILSIPLNGFEFDVLIDMLMRMGFELSIPLNGFTNAYPEESAN